MRETEWKVKYTQAFRLMYIAETLILCLPMSLFVETVRGTDRVTMNLGWSCLLPSLVPSACLTPTYIHILIYKK